MLLEEFKFNRIMDLLHACITQPDLIHRLIVETEPIFNPSKVKAMLSSPLWMPAVSPNTLIDPSSNRMMFARAERIIADFIRIPLLGKNFLDFGCGAGHLAKKAKNNDANVIGYDLSKQWGDEDFLTTDWDKVVSAAPYDIILVYDVLDHSKENPVTCLKKLNHLMKPSGKLYLRCHPWCSRTGNHSYLKKNKAYIHLVLDEEQLEDMGCSGIYTRKIIHPEVTYNDWIGKSGFRVIASAVKTESLESFWGDIFLQDLIKIHWQNSFDEDLARGTQFPSKQLEIQWCDFVLTPTL